MRTTLTGVALLVVGAAVTWSADPHGTGTHLNAVGIAVLVLGAVVLLAGLIRTARPTDSSA
jgi:hypothetical protein